MSKVKKGDVIKCLSTRGHDFFVGCHYQVEKVDSQGFVYAYSDEGDKVAIDYPICPTYGTFKKVESKKVAIDYPSCPMHVTFKKVD